MGVKWGLNSWCLSVFVGFPDTFHLEVCSFEFDEGSGTDYSFVPPS